MKTLALVFMLSCNGCFLIAAGLIEADRKPLTGTGSTTNSSLGNEGESCLSRANCNEGLGCYDKVCRRHIDPALQGRK